MLPPLVVPSFFSGKLFQLIRIIRGIRGYGFVVRAGAPASKRSGGAPQAAAKQKREIRVDQSGLSASAIRKLAWELPGERARERNTNAEGTIGNYLFENGRFWQG